MLNYCLMGAVRSEPAGVFRPKCLVKDNISEIQDRLLIPNNVEQITSFLSEAVMLLTLFLLCEEKHKITRGD